MESKEILNDFLRKSLYNNPNVDFRIRELQQKALDNIEKDLDRLEKYDKVKEFLKTNPSHLSAILGFDNYETFKNYYSYYYTKDVDEEMFNLLKEVFGDGEED